MTDTNSIVRLYHLFHNRLVAQACRQQIQNDEVDDLVQEVWLDICRTGIPGALVGDLSRIMAWLFGILKNKVKDRLRQRRRCCSEALSAYTWEMSLEAREPEPVERVLQDEFVATMRATIDRLASGRLHKSIKCLELRYFEGLTIVQVASVMGMSVSMVSARLQRAKQRVRVVLQE